VTAHLSIGTAFFGTILWIYFSLSQQDILSEQKNVKLGVTQSGNTKLDSNLEIPFWFLCLSLFVLCLVCFQIISGGLVASNYAGLACPDFPLCFGQWIPTLEGAIGLQVIHRFSAYTTFCAVGFLHFIVRLNSKKEWAHFEIFKVTRLTISLVLMQVALGMTNVFYKTPPLVTVLHQMLAVIIFGSVLRVVFVAYTNSIKKNYTLDKTIYNEKDIFLVT
jgi:heme A synthase